PGRASSCLPAFPKHTPRLFSHRKGQAELQRRQGRKDAYAVALSCCRIALSSFGVTWPIDNRRPSSVMRYQPTRAYCRLSVCLNGMDASGASWRRSMRQRDTNKAYYLDIWTEMLCAF